MTSFPTGFIMFPSARQRGVSLIQVVMFGLLAVLSLVYGRNGVTIAYHGYQIHKLIDAISATETVEATMRSRFQKQLEIDQLEEVVKDADLIITQEGTQLKLMVNYRECGKLASHWEICADQSFTSK